MMKNSVLIGVLLIVTSISRAQDSLFVKYKNLNEKEDRLLEYKDSENDLRLKIAQVQIINASRRKYRRTPVQLDILASRVANKMSKEAAENGYLSHWNMKGEKPYHRYSRAGGKDHVVENAYRKWCSYSFTLHKDTLAKFMKEAHRYFMAETPPFDGHKKNCIDQKHNFVGIGFYVHQGNFNYYEEFVDRYYEFEEVPQKVKVGSYVELIVGLDASFRITRFAASKEKALKKKKPRELNFKGSYIDGSNKWVLFTVQEPIVDLVTGKMIYKLGFSFDKSGTYYLKIWHKKVKGKRLVGEDIQASGIMIDVY